MAIRKLSESVINKIAAGEVIERPASVVKELLENSIDAGATQIEVTIEQGGIEMIRITDNGGGIAKEDMPLAVTSHATSKITDADDLFRVGTFGFRGEALASITTISQAMIRSRTADSDCGYELLINGGQAEPIEPCGCPVGTTIEVRQLFYNTPVRQKFLKTPQTEKSHIAEAFARVALANPQVQMTLMNNQSVVHQLAATESWRERISAFYGPEIADNLIPVSSTEREISLNGFVVDPSISRSNKRMQYLFLNRRYIRDHALQHALTEAYRGLLMVGRYPLCFLRLDMPPNMVDVNVHPAKLEVRFQNGGQIYKQLLATIREQFLSTDLTAKGHLSRRDGGRRHDEGHRPDGGHVAAEAVAQHSSAPAVASSVQDQIAFAKPASSTDWTSAPRQSSHSASAGMPGASGSFQPFPPLPASGGSVSTHSMPSAAPVSGGQQAPDNEPFAHPTGVSPHVPSPTQTRTALQVYNTYLISETAEGMVIIDQHALHERVIYEQLREKVLAGKLESQRLLVPEPVSLPPAEAAAVLEQAELLTQIGVTVEPFGGDTVLVSSYPAMLANHNPAEMLKGVIDKLMGEAKNLDRRDVLDELLHMISCKAAVKAGDKLSPEEITALLEHGDLCQDSHHCPHGRPTALTFSREELDKKFKRI
ncbi:DNA mismatch repair endonuclease MutL [Mariniblastus fucicola]|uniref:DNA mismatch repair protein MutL n=1 Tax=Mariniblastus fucicola TaxID=980251 RepID=A0A5B9PGC5_9BACT|nr:DNA mismatch repair endonuclease MutL [Mariniblastus fucicola]QEG24285.1 DNA mismatch repair protein MutL [Mariniblastus fucicola]